jgi:inorganic pyrophosphatase
MFRMRDEQGPTPKVVCVPTAELRLMHLKDVDDVDPFYRLEIGHFFEVYKLLEPGKRVWIEGDAWAGRGEAEQEIRRACARAGHAG